jgi:hypothetical protein
MLLPCNLQLRKKFERYIWKDVDRDGCDLLTKVTILPSQGGEVHQQGKPSVAIVDVLAGI